MRVTSHYSLLLKAALLASAAIAAYGAEISPAGIWKTIDDKTGQARGIIRVYQDNGLWFGRIEASLNPADRNERCDKCSDERKDKPVIGMVIMRGLTRRGAEYNGGDILDPETGWVYRCRFSLSPDGKKLLVRGFIGISVLGRTQTWIRLEEWPVSEKTSRKNRREDFRPTSTISFEARSGVHHTANPCLRFSARIDSTPAFRDCRPVR